MAMMRELNNVCASVAFQPTGDKMATGLENGEIVVLDTQAALQQGDDITIHGHKKRVKSVAFSNSSGQHQLLASGSADKTVRLWDTHTWECVAVLEGHGSWVNSVAFSPDDLLLASASNDGTVRLWDVVGRKAASPADVLRSHEIGSLFSFNSHSKLLRHNVHSVAFHPNGKLLASGSADETVRLWNVPEGVPGPVLQHTCDVLCVAFSPVVGVLATTTGFGEWMIRLYNVDGVEPRLLHKLLGHTNAIHSVAFSPNGSHLISGSYNQFWLRKETMRLWSVANGTELKVWTGMNVLSVAFHPNGEHVALCSGDNAVRLCPC
jgi:WD40 repeat protein